MPPGPPLDPKRPAFEPLSGLTANDSQCATSTTVPNQAKTNSTETDSTPAQHTTTKQLRDRISSLESDIVNLNNEIRRLQRDEAQRQKNDQAQKNTLELEISHRCNKVIELIETLETEITALTVRETDLSTREARFDLERQTWDAQTALVYSMGDPELDQQIRDEVRKRTAALVAEDGKVTEFTNIAVKQQLAKRELENDRSRREARNNFEIWARDFDRKETAAEAFDEAVKTLQYLASKRQTTDQKESQAARKGGRKYTLDDPQIQDLLDEMYLCGYLDLAMRVEKNRAVKKGIKLTEKEMQHLDDPSHKDSPRSVGYRVARKLGWRVLCHQTGRPEWDSSLNTRSFTNANDFWGIVDHVDDSYFDGIEEGYHDAMRDFRDKEDKDAGEELAGFEQVKAKSKSKMKASVQTANPLAQKDAAAEQAAKQHGQSGPSSDINCARCMRHGHTQDDCKYCNKCQKYGHSTEGCLFCRVCGKFGHDERKCLTCNECGKIGHTAEDCYTCAYCKKVGHKVAECRSKQRHANSTGHGKRPRKKTHIIDTQQKSVTSYPEAPVAIEKHQRLQRNISYSDNDGDEPEMRSPVYSAAYRHKIARSPSPTVESWRSPSLAARYQQEWSSMKEEREHSNRYMPQFRGPATSSSLRQQAGVIFGRPAHLHSSPSYPVQGADFAYDQSSVFGDRPVYHGYFSSGEHRPLYDNRPYGEPPLRSERHC